METENYYQVIFNTSGTSSAVLTNNDNIEKVYIEERLTNQYGDNIPMMALQTIAYGKKVNHLGLTSYEDNPGSWSALTKFFSVFSGTSNGEDSQVLTHREVHYLNALASILHSGFEEAHVFCLTPPTPRSEYGKSHESIIIINPKRACCNISFRQMLGPNVPVKKHENWPDSHYNRKTYSVYEAFRCIKEHTECSTFKEMYAVSQLGHPDKLIPNILSKYGGQTSQFKLEGGKQIFNTYEYVNFAIMTKDLLDHNEKKNNHRKKEVYLNLLYRLQKDYEEYLINSVAEYFSSLTRDVASTSKNIVLTGHLTDNVRANYVLLKSLEEGHSLYVDPLCNEVASSMGFAYELIGSSEIIPKAVKNFYLGQELNLEDYSLNDYEDEKSVTPKEVANLLADGNIIAIAQGRAEITDHSLGNRSILGDPRTRESKHILSRSKYQPEHLPVIASTLEESAKEWFDMDRLENSPEAMYAVDALDNTKEKAEGAVFSDGSTRVQTVNSEQNEHFYNLIKEFGDLTGVPMLLNTSLNMHTYPIADTMSGIMEFMRCSGVNYLYLPENSKLLYVPN